MLARQVAPFLKAMAVQAEIDAMKATNEQNVFSGCDLTYAEEHFWEKAQELELLAEEAERKAHL